MSSHFAENTVRLWPFGVLGTAPGGQCVGQQCPLRWGGLLKRFQRLWMPKKVGEVGGEKGSVRDGEGLSLVRCLQELSGFL